MGEVHQIELADEAEAGEARGAGMEGEGALDAIILEERLAAGDLFENFGGKIFAIEEQAELRFVERGIVEKGEEDVWIGMVEQDGEFVAGGGESAFAVLRAGVHHESAPDAFAPD